MLGTFIIENSFALLRLEINRAQYAIDMIVKIRVFAIFLLVATVVNGETQQDNNRKNILKKFTIDYYKERDVQNIIMLSCWTMKGILIINNNQTRYVLIV